ncbi:MAG: hypothetical protein KGQ59_11035, partial [Bdellovibrionales bacterium]|nr:hypothetical protein [Bdellovibrionales bacterium]
VTLSADGSKELRRVARLISGKSEKGLKRAETVINEFQSIFPKGLRLGVLCEKGMIGRAIILRNSDELIRFSAVLLKRKSACVLSNEGCLTGGQGVRHLARLKVNLALAPEKSAIVIPQSKKRLCKPSGVCFGGKTIGEAVEIFDQVIGGTFGNVEKKKLNKVSKAIRKLNKLFVKNEQKGKRD